MPTDPRHYPDADYPLQQLTGRILPAFHHVHYTLGFGFLESVYRKAMAIELRHRGMRVGELVRYRLFHRGRPIGLYEADLVVEGSVILEVKTGLLPDPVAPAQLLNYLKSSRLRVGLVLHFGPSPHVRRVISSGRFSRLASARVIDGTVTDSSRAAHTDKMPTGLPDYER